MSDTVRGPEKDELFFADAIRAQVAHPRFLPRNWLADGVQDRLDEPGCRYVIMTAEPGAGKTAFVAQLADGHQDWLRYFYRRDQRSPLGRPGVRSLLLRLGLQLAYNRPELFDIEHVRISVDQRVGNVEGRGSVVAAEVNRLLASPFHKTVIDIRQTIGSGGAVAGLRVAEWVTDPLLLDVDDLAVMALLDPASALQRIDPGARIVVLIDAVDEVSSRPGDDLMDWLSGLAVPANVRFLLSGRPDPSLRLLAERQPDAVRFVPLTGDPHNIEDIRMFATVLADDLAGKALPEEIDAAALIGGLVLKADGNLGYVAAVARTVDHALASGATPEALGELVDPAQLPDDIQGLYALFLHRIRSGPGERDLRLTDPGAGRVVFVRAWAELYRPILETLCVSREPLTVEQLQALTDTLASIDDVQTAIRNLGQFLDHVGGACNLYHATLAEFMLDPATRTDPATADIAVDAIAAHRRIASILRRELDRIWSDDPGAVEQARRSYARRYLVPHLIDGVLWDELCELLTMPAWGRGSLGWDPSAAAFCADLDAGRQAAVQHGPAPGEAERRLPDLWAFSALRTSLSSVADQLPPDGFALLALQGHQDEASRLARLVTDPSRRVAVLGRMIVTAVRATRADGGAVAAPGRPPIGASANDHALQALTAIEQIAAERPRRLAFLSVTGACQEFAACGQPLDVAVKERLEALASSFPGEADQAAAWCRLVRLYNAAGDTAAVELGLDHIRRTAGGASSRADTCWGLATHVLAELGRLDEAVEAARHLQGDPDAWLEALQALIAGSPPGGVPGGVIEGLGQLRAWAIEDATPDTRSRFLVGLADAYGTTFPAEASACALEAADALRLSHDNNQWKWTVPAVAKALDHHGPPGAADVLLTELAEAAAREIEANPPIPGHGYVFHIREANLAEGLVRANRTTVAHRLIATFGAHERRAPLRHAAVACAHAGRWDEARSLIEDYEAAETGLTLTLTREGDPLPPLFPPAADNATFDNEDGERSPGTDLALALAAAGERQAAITEAQHLDDNRDRVAALTGIALQDRFEGRLDDSARLLAEVRSLLRTERFKPVETSARAAALSLLVESGEVSAAAALLHRWAPASEDRPQLANSVVTALIARKDPEAIKPLLALLAGEARVRALVKLAALQPPAAPSLLADAAKQTEAIDAGITKVRLLIDVARASFTAGMVDDARGYIMAAWKANNAVTIVRSRPTPWVDIFTELVRYGEANLALRTMRQIPDNEPYDAVITRCKIAEIAEESSGDVDPAGLLEEAATLTDAVTFPPIRNSAKQRVARSFTALGMTERALAEDLAGDDPAAVTAVVASELAALGRLDQAQRLLEGRTESLPEYVGTALVRALLKAGDLDGALRTADGMEDAQQEALLAVASALQEVGRSEDAQRIARRAWTRRPSAEAGRCLVTIGLRGDVTKWLQDRWLAATTPGEVVGPMGILVSLLPTEPDLAAHVVKRCEWVSSFLQTA